MSASLGEKHKINVLVVDDQKIVADSLAWILNLAGFNACTAYSGSEAISHAIEHPVDILVSDVSMDGMSGIEAAIEIRKLLPTCKVLLVSGNFNNSDMLYVPHAPVPDFGILAKPVHPSVIINYLKAMTGSNQNLPF